jgi:poly(hydroxyalkanoate) depolymerase family esterase
MVRGSGEHTEGVRRAGTTTTPGGIVHRARARLGVALALLAAVAVVVPGTAAAASLTSGDYSGPVGTLHYELFVPSSYQAGTPVPLVVALHGCTQTAAQFRQLTRWDAQAESKGFIVVFPQQDPSNNQLKCWNFFQDSSMHRPAGDPARIAAVTSLIENTYNVDPHRVYVAGLSSGGAMASVLGATYPDYFAAIGVGSGCEYAATATCAGYRSADPAQAAQAAYKEMGGRARPMPFIAFQGDADTTVPPANADQLVQQWLTTDDMADDGALNGSVPSRPAKTTPNWRLGGGRSYTVSSYVDAQKAELGQYWLVRGMNHAWSGGAASQQYSDPSGPDETGAMYAFFQSHPAPSLTRPAAPTQTSPAAAPAAATARPAAPGTSGAAAPGAPTARPAAGAPRVSKPRLSHGRIVFTVSRPGWVTLRLQRRVGKHLTTRARIVRAVAKAGRVTIALPRRLAPGTYRVVVTPADRAGRSGTSRTVAVVMR